MGGHLVIDGNAFYEIDDACLRRREEERRGERTEAEKASKAEAAETEQSRKLAGMRRPGHS